MQALVAHMLHIPPSESEWMEVEALAQWVEEASALAKAYGGR